MNAFTAPISAAGSLAVAVVGMLTAAAAAYLFILAVAAFRPRARPAASVPVHRLAVLVPAHNEAELVERCVASLRAQSYPPELFEIFVIADNCTDATARRAAAAGATVMERRDPAARGKGQALRWAMDRILAERMGADAIVVVDADSVAEPGLLLGLEREMSAGAEVVQGNYRVLTDEDGRSELRAAAFQLFHEARFAGRAALGLPCNLVGNGMLFARGLLQRHPWSAFTGAEDLEFSTDLRIAGVRPVYAPDAIVSGPAATTGSAGDTQRWRWEGGRFHVMRTRLPRLIGKVVVHRKLDVLDAFIDLAVPPLGLMLMIALGGALISEALGRAGLLAVWAAFPWLLALLLLPAYVLVGLRAVRAPASAYRALLQTPVFLAAKLGTYGRMLTHGLRADQWRRTERIGAPLNRTPSDGTRGDARVCRVSVGGIPIDAVCIDAAAGIVMDAVQKRLPTQVCTVNLDFLVRARRDPSTRRVLRYGYLNVADGAPVVWLARLLGQRLPGRVAGADLVPAVCQRAAASGARVYLLGGQNGAAVEAARRLCATYPGMIIAGTHEPPVARIEDMDSEAIVRRIEAARADILLVAFGHPKQERWIALNRPRLTVPVAIGVGCTLDLLAGRAKRAPRWMQGLGMEWAYRLFHDPRRLIRRYLTDLSWLVLVLAPLTMLQRMRGNSLIGADAEGLSDA
jgi:exopolysaccharide biosynthesis WecB/TagA/CpsF family protein